MVKWVCQTVWSELNQTWQKPAPGWTRTLLYSLAIKKCREKHTTQSGWETSSEAGLVMAQGRGHYLTHVRLPFKRGHGSSHHPLHSTRLRDAEVLQRERQVVTALWHLRSRCLPPSIGAPLHCFASFSHTLSQTTLASSMVSPGTALMTVLLGETGQVLVNTEGSFLFSGPEWQMCSWAKIPQGWR